MNRLQLVQRLWLECGASGTSPGPSTTIGQTGGDQRLVTWTDAAWQDIQNAHQDFDWLRASASFTTVAGTSQYTLGAAAAGTVGVTAATFGKWCRDTARAYLTATGTDTEVFLDYIDYDTWRNKYLYGTARGVNTAPSTEYSIAPNKAICIPPALAGYTVTLDYFTAPVELSADEDTPAMPAHFHMAIVYRAMMSYGAYEGASEVYDRGEAEFGKLMRRMTADRLPEITLGGPLA